MAGWPYNSRRWRRLRLAHLIAEPMCRYCAEQGRVTVATLVDHIVPVMQNKLRAYDATNLQSLCASCHSGAKAKEEARGGERIGCDVDGVPLKGWK